MANENALVPVAQYAVMTMPQADLQEVFQENLGGGTISVTDLDRVKFPTGGMTAWTVPSLEGEEITKEIEGVIIFKKDSRVYFSKTFEESGGQDAPDCVSDDGQNGLGLIAQQHGGNCATCPLAQFGSGRNGGQACTLNMNLFILAKDNLLPLVVKIPPTSYKIARKYLIGLTGKMRPYYSVSTKLALKKVQNAGGIAYAELVITTGQVLTPEETAQMKAVHENLKPMLNQVRMENVVVDTEGGVSFDDGEEIGGVDLD